LASAAATPTTRKCRLIPGKREGQDRAGGSGGSRSPVDSMHVDAPKQQDNARGHAQQRARE
jgi:hypothetical protein